MRRGLLLVVVAAVAAFGGMSLGGAGGAEKPDDVPLSGAVAAAPPAACVNGAGDIGETYYPGLGNGGYDVSHYDLNLKYNPTRTSSTARRRSPRRRPRTCAGSTSTCAA